MRDAAQPEARDATLLAERTRRPRQTALRWVLAGLILGAAAAFYAFGGASTGAGRHR